MDDLDYLMALCFGGAIGARRRQRGRRRVPAGAWVVVRDGKPVSHVRLVNNALSLYGCRVKIASIGGVCTHPDYRGQGIAGALLDHCMETAAGAGAGLVLISGDRDLYRRAQAVDAGLTLEVALTPGSIDAPPGAPEARPAVPEDWRSCAQLYQSEPVRFVRSADFFAQALSRHGRRGLWIIERAGSALAYMRLSRYWGAPAGDRRRVLAEYAGSRAALVDALPSLFEAGEFKQIEFWAPHHDREMAHLLDQRGMELRPRTIADHTIRLLDLPRLMQRLRPYVAARLRRAEARGLRFEQRERGCVFALGDEKVELDLAQSAKLVLGGPGTPRVEGELGSVLNSLFPLPFPLPGLNYV
jgi:GNAT superfamily N-acetyltransferase